MVNNENNKEKELQTKLEEIRLRGQEDTAKNLAQQKGIKFVNLKISPIDTATVFLVPEEEARRANITTFQKDGKSLKVAVLDPDNEEALKVLEDLKRRGFDYELYTASPLGLSWAWEKYQEKQEIKQKSLGMITVENAQIKKFQEQIKDYKQVKEKLLSVNTTELFSLVIAGALSVRGSDIHIEPEEYQTRLRYRIDGVLQDIVDLDKEKYKDLLNRIKLTSGLKINITETAQDGRFTIRLEDIDIEVRVSVLPGAYGETIVMRILDPRSIKADIESIGFRPDIIALIKKQLGRPAGAILMTGPTGSGKTTSLYAFLTYLNDEGTKIITIENPIEYHVEGISQTQVEASKGYTFANGLRAIVRQDPDVILVGEIRDQETAEIAMNASLTGHIVLSTLHTNDAAGSIPRLINLGVDPAIIAPAISTAMAQRLVRRLCEFCKTKSKITDSDLLKMKETLSSVKHPDIKIPLLDNNLEIYYPGAEGCDKCGGLGYKGRIAVIEVFLIDSEMEKLILTKPAISTIKELAIKKGMVTYLQDAFLKVLDGVTSVEEVVNAIGYQSSS